jgi:hypothetical protein
MLIPVASKSKPGTGRSPAARERRRNHLIEKIEARKAIELAVVPALPVAWQAYVQADHKPKVEFCK